MAVAPRPSRPIRPERPALSPERPARIPPEPSPVPSEASSSAAPRRLTVPLDANGRVDISGRMHQTTRDALKQALGDPKLAAHLGLTADASAITLPPALSYALLDAVQTLDRLIIARMTKAPRDIIEQIVVFSDAERAMLTPALMDVLSKYGGPLLSKYGSEIALLTALTSLTMAKADAVRAAMNPAASKPIPFAAPAEAIP